MTTKPFTMPPTVFSNRKTVAINGRSSALTLLLNLIGVPGIFALTAVLALGGVLVVLFVVPRPAELRIHREAEAIPAQFGRILTHGQLLRLDAGIFILHAILTGTFVVLPLLLRDEAAVLASDHWKIYLPVLKYLGVGRRELTGRMTKAKKAAAAAAQHAESVQKPAAAHRPQPKTETTPPSYWHRIH